VVDNFTLDGTTLALSSGSLTLDAAGDVILDADSDIIRVYASGTHFGSFYSTSNDFLIYSAASDKDIIFQGNDGGSTVTALTLDMSTGGTAYFADDVVADAFLPTTAGAYGSNHVGVHSSGVVLNAATSQTGYIMSAGSSAMTFGPTGATIQLGGLGAANKLDDYEEGTWTPTYTDDSGNVITNLTDQGGRYVKVGNLVYISGQLRTQSSSSTSGLSGNLSISGLPFTQANSGSSGMVSFYTHETSGSYNAPAQLPRSSTVTANTTRISIYKYSGSGGRTIRFLVSDLTMSGNSNFMLFSGTYEA
jgi:hypothetical protein